MVRGTPLFTRWLVMCPHHRSVCVWGPFWFFSVALPPLLLEVYSNLHPVASTVRIVKVLCQASRLMPWFQSPDRTQSDLKAVEETLRNDYMVKGILHGDIAWRNVGVYHGDDGKTRAVVFDMQKVRRVNRQEDWVTSAVSSLSQKSMHDVFDNPHSYTTFRNRAYLNGLPEESI